MKQVTKNKLCQNVTLLGDILIYLFVYLLEY